MDPCILLNAIRGVSLISESDIEVSVPDLIPHYGRFCKANLQKLERLFNPDGFLQLQAVATSVKLSGGEKHSKMFSTV